MLNALSIDVEDYFQVEAFSSRISYAEWDGYPSRIESNVNRILEILAAQETKATFFVLGWIAQKFPQLVSKIAIAGHEIGCHGFAHQRINRLTPEQFRLDIRSARQRLMEQVQQPVACYRAPCFSIVRATMWATDILIEEGFLFDSSIFPVRHDFYGIPGGERFPHWLKTPRGQTMFEFPPSTVRGWDNNWAVAGGGYLRLAPYAFTQWAIRRINESEGQPAMVYFHPWEIDPEQPRVAASHRSRFRHYTNLSTTETKLRHLLRDFRFTTLTNVSRQLASFNSGQSHSVTLAASA
jgi:polysaccharide deacetylase family protein (PEP-CTERM system associated)